MSRTIPSASRKPSLTCKRVVSRSVAIAGTVAILVTTGCYSAPIMPPTGILFSSIAAPESLSINGQNVGARKGEARCTSILSLIAFGDCGAKAAADAGGITQVRHLDYAYMNVLGVYQSLTTIAYGD